MKYLLLVLFLTGCEMRIGVKPRACTAEQLTLMFSYIEKCERGFDKSHCFTQAEEAYCEEKKK
jgi:hypothetical protein